MNYEQIYQKIFSQDRIERWKSWKGNRDTKISVQECGDHPMAEIPEKKKRWNGGVTHSGGYRFILVPSHPKANRNGYVAEHIMVAEMALGRFLPDEAIVHHVNENKMDNRPGNLIVCENKAYHNMIHRRMRAIKECGNPDWLRCSLCKRWDVAGNLYVRIGFNRFAQARHPECHANDVKVRARLKLQSEA